MPLMSPGCTSLPPEPCAGGCGAVAGARSSDGKWWCSICAGLPAGIRDAGNGADLFRPRQTVTYHNGRRYYVRYPDHGGAVLLDENGRQMPEDKSRRLRHLLGVRG